MTAQKGPSSWASDFDPGNPGLDCVLVVVFSLLKRCVEGRQLHPLQALAVADPHPAYPLQHHR